MTEPGPSRRPAHSPRMTPAFLRWLDVRIPAALLLGAAALAGLALAGFVALGGVNVSADKPDGWLTYHLLHFTFKRSEAAHGAGDTPPADLSSPWRVRLAAQHFDMVCANCHGRPGYGQSVTALSMSPRPQYLPKVIGQFTDRELFQIVLHGVKYSAMPSWPTDLRGDEVWSMVAFLRQLPTMDPKAYSDMTTLPAEAAGGPRGTGGVAAVRPADPSRNSYPFDEFHYAAPARGFEDQTIIEGPARTCARCHGADGSGAVTGGEAPNLTLQDPGYLEASLKAYTSGARKSGFMQTVAAELTGAQVADLARFYAGRPARSAPSGPLSPRLLARGQEIARTGIPATAVPACATCHDSAGAKIINAPHLAGQSRIYLDRELFAMSRGGRGSTNWWNPMPSLAHALSAEDRAAVAVYYASLPPARASSTAPAAAGAGGSAHGPPAGAAPGPSGGAVPVLRVGSDTGGGDMAMARRIFTHDCQKCHEPGGRGDRQGNYPDLTLQTAPFVLQNLHAFRSGARPNDKMRQMAGGLSFKEMRDLALYIGALPPQPGLARPDAGAAARGAAIAIHGDKARGVPACLSCHDAAGVAALPLIPRLQGQNAFYLRRRLALFAQPYGKNLSTLNPMPLIAGKLTDQELTDLAAYFAATAPLPK